MKAFFWISCYLHDTAFYIIILEITNNVHREECILSLQHVVEALLSIPSNLFI